MVKKSQIEKWNFYFKSLTKAEKKIAIAKDILTQLKIKKYKANSGSYIKLNYYEFDLEDDIQSNFDKIKCDVCALGSAVMSCIKYTNNVKFNDVYSSQGEVFTELIKIFTKKELVLMEYCFEGFVTDFAGVSDKWGILLSEKGIEKTRSFYEKYTDPDKRLKAIMNIVIKNGKFKI